jgi:MOSC domain-containing protein YiiM
MTVDLTVDAVLVGRPVAFGPNGEPSGIHKSSCAGPVSVTETGLDEADVCIGDVFDLGTARVQVAQGRQPCWRLNVRFGRKDMAWRVQATGRTGWYYRVLVPGEVAPGDRLFLVHRPNPAWPLTMLLDVLYRDTLNAEALAAVKELPDLAESWRALAHTRLKRQEVEDWTRRLTTPERH